MARLAAAALVLSLVLFSGCKPSPTKIYMKAMEAKKKKKEQRFLAFFTKESRTVIDKLLEMSRAKRYVYLKDPYELLPYKIVEKEEIDEANGVATLTTKRDKFRLRVVMVRQDGEWRIDGLQLKTLFTQKAAQ